MTQKTSKPKPNHSRIDSHFEISVKIPKGIEFNLKLPPRIWRKFMIGLKQPLLWWLVIICSSSSVIGKIQPNHPAPNAPTPQNLVQP
jgi:hypothetical protein